MFSRFATDFHRQSLQQLRSSLPRDVAQSVACVIIRSWLDYCNSLYYGMSNTNFQRLQTVQNVAAQIVCQAKLHDANITQLTSIGYLCVVESTTRLPSSATKLSNCNNPRILFVHSRHIGSRMCPEVIYV